MAAAMDPDEHGMVGMEGTGSHPDVQSQTVLVLRVVGAGCAGKVGEDSGVLRRRIGIDEQP